MKATTLVLAGALAALVAAPAQAQQPDFSGTWQLGRDASEIPEFGGGRRGGPGGFGGAAATVVITQSSDLLTIEQQNPRGSRSVSYRLDGSESTSPGPRGDRVTPRAGTAPPSSHRGHDADVVAYGGMIAGVYGRVFQNLADVRAAVAEFVERYNRCWRLEKLAYRTPLEAREEYELR